MRADWTGRICGAACGAVGLAAFWPTLGHGFGYDHSDVHAVSDTGLCAGQYHYDGIPPDGGTRQPLKYDGGSTPVTLNSLMGTRDSGYEAVATALSRDSLVIGGGSNYPGGGSLLKPVIWRNSATPTALTFIPGGDEDNDGLVLALNGDGTLAGGYTCRSPTGEPEAFIWDAAGGTRALQQVLTAQFGIDLTGWSLQQVTAISADGLVLAGIGSHDGRTEGWIVHVCPGDLDRDDDVDLDDFGRLQRCLGTASASSDPACAAADLSGDNSVGTSDVGIFMSCMSGAGIPRHTLCTNP